MPDTIGNLTNLTRLHLDGNQLTALPDTIGNLTNLSWLYLDDNKLTALPTGIPARCGVFLGMDAFA